MTGLVDWAALAQADLVVEAVFEDLAVKQAVFQRIDRIRSAFFPFGQSPRATFLVRPISIHLMMPLYLCRKWRGEVRPREGQEIKWVRAARLADFDMPPADKPLVAPRSRDNGVKHGNSGEHGQPLVDVMAGERRLDSGVLFGAEP